MALRYRDLTPSEDVLRNLDRSRRKAALIKTRYVRCPYCKRILAVVPVGQTDMMFPKCQKCKFEGPLDPRYFRRMKAYWKRTERPQKVPIR
jgi:hypothetical protein